MIIEGFMDTIRKASNFARKHVNNAINTYKYLTGERDSRYEYTAKASEADIKKTPFGQKTYSNTDIEYKVKDKETGKTVTKKLEKGRPLYKDFEKLGVKYEAKKDPNNNMVRIRFRSDEVPVAVARLLDPKYKDGAKLRQYMTDFTGGYVVLEFPMDEGKKQPNKGKTKDKNKSNPDSGDTNESMMTPVQVPLRGRTLQCDKDGHIIVRESYDMKNLYKELKSKLVVDSDGFLTDYTMYYDIENDQYIFIFGDRDIYTPDNSDTDFECETREEAEEWFDDYEGPGYEDWYNEDDEEDLMAGDLEDQFDSLMSEEEESINYGGATSNIPASKPSSIDLIDKPRFRRDDKLQLRVDEDYWFGGDGKVEEPDQSLEDKDGEPLQLDIKDLTKEDEDQDAEDATESLELKTPEDDSDESVGLNDPKDKKKSTMLNETPGLELSIPKVVKKDPEDIDGRLEITINGKLYKYRVNPDSKGLTAQDVAGTVSKMMKYSDGKALAYLKKNMHVVEESLHKGSRVKLDAPGYKESHETGTVIGNIGEVYWINWDDGTTTQEIKGYLSEIEDTSSSLEEMKLVSGSDLVSKSGHKIHINDVETEMSDYDGHLMTTIYYDYEMTDGSKGSSKCNNIDLWNMLKE